MTWISQRGLSHQPRFELGEHQGPGEAPQDALAIAEVMLSP